jgi:hypothetical protein
MLILDDTDRSLTAVLSGAVMADQLDFVASYVDVQAPDTYEPAANHGVTNDSTPVTLVAAPSSGRRRQLKFLSISNVDSQANEVAVGYLDNATTRNILTVTLAVGSTLVYTDGEGFRVIDTTGNILVTANP